MYSWLRKYFSAGNVALLAGDITSSTRFFAYPRSDSDMPAGSVLHVESDPFQRHRYIDLDLIR